MIEGNNDVIDVSEGRAIKIIILTFCFLLTTLNGIASEALFKNLSKSEIANLFADLNPESREKKLFAFYLTADQYDQFVLLTKLAKTEIELQKFREAKDYADKLMTLSENYIGDWNYGNAVHDANMVLGIVALHNDFIDKAKEYLIMAGQAPSSPQIRTYGPNMMLAKALLERGEKQTVITYFELLKKVWTNNDGRLDSWIASIKGGGDPYFGINLYL